MPKRKRSTTKTCTEQPAPKSVHFPFLKLPAEIRNSIYQHCLPVDRHQLCSSPDDDVNTSLLCVNKQVYTEALAILYSGSISVSIGKFKSIAFRHDQAAGGYHALRNGRLVSMTSFTGRIYPHVLARFREIVLSIEVLWRKREYLRPGGIRPAPIDVMVESPQLELQIADFLQALKPTLRSSFTGPRVRDFKINTDSMKNVLNTPERVAEFKRGLKRLLLPFAQLFGFQSVQIAGVSDQDYAHQLKRIMEGHGLVPQEARQALVRMIDMATKTEHPGGP